MIPRSCPPGECPVSVAVTGWGRPARLPYGRLPPPLGRDGQEPGEDCAVRNCTQVHLFHREPTLEKLLHLPPLLLGHPSLQQLQLLVVTQVGSIKDLPHCICIRKLTSGTCWFDFGLSDNLPRSLLVEDVLLLHRLSRRLGTLLPTPPCLLVDLEVLGVDVVVLGCDGLRKVCTLPDWHHGDVVAQLLRYCNDRPPSVDCHHLRGRKGKKNIIEDV